ncbi:hypothetical protein DPMN_173278 [Dreissena polymorpha]|uniref:Uncharacterized protein n=1 Tax=Dreissena polymorpha TaxID=45954 RepID=A0A9D4IFY1_DREPO|nr:hypothetical protein DPMN_173278 [Dreissena polymorpha]
MYASCAIQDGHEEPHPDNLQFIVSGCGSRERSSTIKTGGVLWLTWSVACDLPEAREGACADRKDAEKERRLLKLAVAL